MYKYLVLRTSMESQQTWSGFTRQFGRSLRKDWLIWRPTEELISIKVSRSTFTWAISTTGNWLACTSMAGRKYVWRKGTTGLTVIHWPYWMSLRIIRWSILLGSCGLYVRLYVYIRIIRQLIQGPTYTWLGCFFPFKFATLVTT